MKIAMLYPTFGGGLPTALESVFTDVLGECSFVHLGESDLLGEVIACNGLTRDLLSRLMGLYHAAVQAKADLVLCTCSSIGRSAEIAAEIFEGPPILRIDEAMALHAVTHYERIALMATVGSTLEPSCELIRRVAAKAGRTVTLSAAVAPGAWDALRAGDQKHYASILHETAQELARGSDVIALAQASMASLAQDLCAACKRPVLSTPRLCAEYIRDHIQKKPM